MAGSYNNMLNTMSPRQAKEAVVEPSVEKVDTSALEGNQSDKHRLLRLPSMADVLKQCLAPGSKPDPKLGA